MHTSTSSSYLPKMSSLQYFKVTFFSPEKIRSSFPSKQVFLFSSSTKRLHCGVWVGTIYHNSYNMHFFRVKDFFHSKFFLTLGNIRLFPVIDNRSFQGIDSAPKCVEKFTVTDLNDMVSVPSLLLFYSEIWYFYHHFMSLKSFWLSVNEIPLLIMASVYDQQK